MQKVARNFCHIHIGQNKVNIFTILLSFITKQNKKKRMSAQQNDDT